MFSGGVILPGVQEIVEVGFYSDDGKSTLFSAEDSGNGKEGRQAIGMLVRTSDDAEELWVIPYRNLPFEQVPNSAEGPNLENAVQVELACDDEGGLGGLIAKSKCLPE